MVNDENDKWADNGDLPINPVHSSKQPEEKKRKVPNNISNNYSNQKEMSMEKSTNGLRHNEEPITNMAKNDKSKEEPIANMAKRKIFNSMPSTHSDQRELSMEELMNDSKYREKSIKHPNDKPENIQTVFNTEDNIKNYVKKESLKNNKPIGILSTVEANNNITKTSVNNTNKTSVNNTTKESTSNRLPKDTSNTSKTENNKSKEEQDNVTTKEIDIPKDLTYVTQEPIKESLQDENQKLKDQLKKLKEEIKEPQYIKDLSKYIKNLDSNIGHLANNLRTFTDAKSWEAISRGKLEARKYANYYDVHNTITNATASDPHDFDSAAYNVERIFESLERFSEIIYVTNDGTDNLYIIVSHGGRTRFSTEAILYPGEVKCYFNTYEIRLRSPTAGLPYRVTEYCLANISEISTIPIEKANLHNQALPAANTNWLAADITPTNYPTTFMIETAVSIAGSFRAVVTRALNAQTVTFNVVPGPALVPGGLYIFNLLVHNGDSVNFTYDATGGTIMLLRVQELDSASA